MEKQKCFGFFDNYDEDCCVCVDFSECSGLAVVNADRQCDKCINQYSDYANRLRCHVHCDFIYRLQEFNHTECFGGKEV